MKTTNKFLALALMAVAMVFVSCSKDDDNEPTVPTQQEIETKIIGKWKLAKTDGIDVLTNKRQIDSFFGDGTGTSSLSDSREGVRIWDNKIKVKYYTKENTLSVNILTYKMELSYSVLEIDSENFKRIKHYSNKNDQSQDLVKVTADYSQDIIGMWEGVEMTGYETYGNAEARIEYRADGSYTYYSGVENYWVPSANVDNEYNVDGDWLATRWRPEAGADYNYEWWDIDYIKGDEMKWSALREKEDGTRFTTTFTWKKIVE